MAKSSPSSLRPRRPWRSAAIALGITLALLLIVRLGRAAVIARQLVAMAPALQEQVTALQQPDADVAASVQNLRVSLTQARSMTSALRRSIWPFGGIAKGLAWVPGIGDDIAAAPYTLEMMDHLLISVGHLDTAFSPLIEPLLGGAEIEGDLLTVVSETVAASEADVASARLHLNQARSARSHLNPVGLNPRLAGVITQADQLIGALDQGLTAAEALPTLLGVNHPHHVLILLQNADEIRPSGGFITSSAYVVIDKGQIQAVEVLNSFSPEIDRQNIMYYEPPFPYRDYMKLPAWLFRDANWSPDYPTSANLAADLYSAGRGVPVDTVIAINQYTVRDFMVVMGDFTLEDGTVINAENVVIFFQQLWDEYSTEQGFDSRKDFIPELAPLLMQRFLSIRTFNQARDTWRMAEIVGNRRDLLIYSREAPLQRVSETMAWDGGVPTTWGDYLYVVNTNMGYNKTDLIIQQQMDYHVSLLDPAHPYSVLDINYNNPALADYISAACPHALEGGVQPLSYTDRAHDCYVNFLRLYVPDQTQMLESPWFLLPSNYIWTSSAIAGQVNPMFDERSKAVFGGLMVVSQGTNQQARFRYLLDPRSVMVEHPNGLVSYRLLIQKQAGVKEYPVRVTVDLPPGAGLVNVSPQPTYIDANSLYFDLSLNADITIQVDMVLPPEMRQQAGLEVAESEQPAWFLEPRIVSTQPPLPTLYPTVSPDGPVSEETQEEGDPTSTPTATPTPVIFSSVLAVRSNVRSGPGVQYPVLGTLDLGSTVMITQRDTTSSWVYIIGEDDVQGWVAIRLINDPIDVALLPTPGEIAPPEVTATPAPRGSTPTPRATSSGSSTPAPTATQGSAADFVLNPGAGAVCKPFTWDVPARLPVDSAEDIFMPFAPSDGTINDQSAFQFLRRNGAVFLGVFVEEDVTPMNCRTSDSTCGTVTLEICASATSTAPTGVGVLTETVTLVLGLQNFGAFYPYEDTLIERNLTFQILEK